MAATTKLIVVNAALRELGAHPLADLSTATTAQQEMLGAWDHAVESALALRDWNFARRRATLTGATDSSYPPYTYRYSKPSDFLRKTWVKSSASDDYQADHAEIAAAFYGFLSTVLVEYISDHSSNYDPANWPPHFTKMVTFLLAMRCAPKLARAGAETINILQGQISQAAATADEFEVVYLTNTQIATNRYPVMRRAIEFLGQQLSGSVAVHSQTDRLRWHMNRSWDHAVKYVLEQGAWNFATRRTTLTGGSISVPGDITADVIEGYSLAPATETDPDDLPDMAGYDYGYTLPDDFLHKIWLKADANETYERPHQFMRNAVYTTVEPVVLEYVALDDDSTDPDNWSANFLEAVAAYLALMVAPEFMVSNGSGKQEIQAPRVRDRLEQVFLAKLSDAKLRDAIQQYPTSIPPGRFARARAGRTSTLIFRRSS